VEAESSYLSEISFADVISGPRFTPLPGTAGLGAVAW
jgi:hypothetical protein